MSHWITKRVLPFGLTATYACAALAVGPVYELTCLDCAFGTSLLPLGLNDAGVIIATDDTSCAFPEGCLRNGQGYVIAQGAIMQSPFFEGGNASRVLAVNSAGVIVGNATMPEWPTGPFGYSYDGTTMTDLGDTLDTWGDNYFSYATSLNENGIIVGVASNGSTQDVTPFSYKNGLMTAIPYLPGAYSILQYPIVRINRKDHMIGTALVSANDEHIAWISRNGVTQALAPASDKTEVYAINDSDQAVGFMRVYSDRQHNLYNEWPVVWSRRGTRLLNTLPDYADHGQANAINNAGWVVGQACSTYACTPFVFNGKKMFDLNTRLSASGTGWTMLQATGIDSLGRIVGFAKVYTEDSHAVLLTPRS